MSRLLDPVELLERRINREIGKVDADGTYPCAHCGKRFPIEQMVCLSPMGDGPLVCDFDCNGEQDESKG
jgi:hypothetical protein